MQTAGVENKKNSLAELVRFRGIIFSDSEGTQLQQTQWKHSVSDFGPLRPVWKLERQKLIDDLLLDYWKQV